MQKIFFKSCKKIKIYFFTAKVSKIAGMCNQQVARLRVNRLPFWIPQVGCYAPDSKCGHPPTNQGVLHVNNNGDVSGLLFVNMGSHTVGN